MQKFETTNTFITGVFPDTVSNNSTGAATPDGFEYIKACLDNAQLGPLQAIMDYSAGNTNVPTGSVGVPNAVTEAAGVSQIVEALHKMTGSGPGTVKPYMKEDAPAVTGDRVILLAEQGVLIASYPDLDAATWITGNTAAQVAAIAAGKYFYRSSDAAGLVGDAAGPYLQLPPNLQPTFFKTYFGDTVGSLDFTVSSNPAITVLAQALAIPYQTSDGTWKLKLNIGYDVASASRTTALCTVSGITTPAYEQTMTMRHNINTALYQQFVTTSSNTFNIQHSSGGTTRYNFSGEIELASKPTWADDFEIQWGITY